MRSILALLLLAVLAGPSGAELQLDELFGEGMVVQRDSATPIWGTSDPDAEVRVALAGRTATVRADTGGRWRAELGPLAAGGPFELRVESGDRSLTLGDVLVGDVWICSGQSNMEWTVADSMNAEAEIAAARDSGIRHFKVPRSWAEEPEDELAGGSWEIASPEHVGSFTAVGYFFARELRRHHDVPIGLVNATWGGSRLEPWMSAEALGLDAEGMADVLEAERAAELAILERVRSQIGELPESDRGMVDGRPVWADPDLDDSAWTSISAASLWEEQDWEGMDGVAWYRTSFELSAEEARADLQLGLGTIDDSDTAWVNGQEVGSTVLQWNLPRVYTVPSEVLREGRNVIAIRVEDTGGGGGLYGPAETRYIEVAGSRRPLDGEWRFEIGLVTVDSQSRKNQIPTLLYNKMIHPLLEFPVAGILWYQGESNTAPADAFVYRELFPTMIRDWRARWGRAELPFLWVQLANFLPARDEPGDSDWATLRESQSAALGLSSAAQAVAIDIGDADDVHPRNKQEVGRRLALAARGLVFSEDLVFSGPVYRSHTIEEDRVIIDFDHVGGGLVTANDAELQGFAVAGTDRRWHWAQATIEGDRVVVRSEAVPEPVAVRYAWADNPERANLYNEEGLPAAPFRTDSW